MLDDEGATGERNWKELGWTVVAWLVASAMAAFFIAAIFATLLIAGMAVQLVYAMQPEVLWPFIGGFLMAMFAVLILRNKKVFLE